MQQNYCSAQIHFVKQLLAGPRRRRWRLKCFCGSRERHTQSPRGSRSRGHRRRGGRRELLASAARWASAACPGPRWAAQPASPARSSAARGTLAAGVYSRLQSALHKYRAVRYLHTLPPGFINIRAGQCWLRRAAAAEPHGRAPGALPRTIAFEPCSLPSRALPGCW